MLETLHTVRARMPFPPLGILPLVTADPAEALELVRRDRAVIV